MCTHPSHFKKMATSGSLNKKNTKKCQVCGKKLRIHEGRLCSCSLLLCMKHRYKFNHACQEESESQSIMEKIVAQKIAMI